MREKPKIPIILGATGVGKTEIALQVAKSLNGEIISADSRQVYRWMDIGTAKSTIEERRRIRHHLLDILEPEENFSAGEFVQRALEAIEEIQLRGKVPIIVGGAGLYIRALTRGIFEGKTRDLALRQELFNRYQRNGGETMWRELHRIDPQYAQKVHVQDKKKLLRALEIYQFSGMTVSELGKVQCDGWVEGVLCGLTRPREKLYERINARVEKMIEAGLVEEVKRLHSRNVPRESNSINSPGYKEVYDFLEEKISFKEMIELIKRNSRRYAKRQMTWFRKEKEVRWFEVGENTAKQILEYIKSSLKIR